MEQNKSDRTNWSSIVMYRNNLSAYEKQKIIPDKQLLSKIKIVIR